MTTIEIIGIVGVGNLITIAATMLSSRYRRGKIDQQNMETKANLDALISEMRIMTTAWNQKYDQRVAYVEQSFVKQDKLCDIINPIKDRLASVEAIHIGEKLATLETKVDSMNNSWLTLTQELVKALKEIGVRL